MCVSRGAPSSGDPKIKLRTNDSCIVHACTFSGTLLGIWRSSFVFRNWLSIAAKIEGSSRTPTSESYSLFFFCGCSTSSSSPKVAKIALFAYCVHAFKQYIPAEEVVVPNDRICSSRRVPGADSLLAIGEIGVILYLSSVPLTSF